MPTRRRPPAHARRPDAGPLLHARDFQAYLRRHAQDMAPDDVDALIAQQRDIRRRAAEDGRGLHAFAQQVGVALDLLEDHRKGRVTHVPYSTVALLAAALFYFVEPVGVIPDVVSGIGLDDDALVMELAFRDGADGIARYRAWRETVTPPARSPRRPARGR